MYEATIVTWGKRSKTNQVDYIIAESDDVECQQTHNMLIACTEVLKTQQMAYTEYTCLEATTSKDFAN